MARVGPNDPPARLTLPGVGDEPPAHRWRTKIAEGTRGSGCLRQADKRIGRSLHLFIRQAEGRSVAVYFRRR